MLLAKAEEKPNSSHFLENGWSMTYSEDLDCRPKLIWELFQVGKEHSPSTVFIDEIDTIVDKR